jgi:hypothetical protein
LPRRRGRCLYFYREVLEKNLLQFDSVGTWSEQRFTLNVVERVIPVNESPVIRSVPVEQIRLENIYSYKINAFDPNNDYLTYQISRGDGGDQSFAVDVDIKLTGTAIYSEQWTDFRLYDEDDNDIALTYDTLNEDETEHSGRTYEYEFYESNNN